MIVSVSNEYTIILPLMSETIISPLSYKNFFLISNLLSFLLLNTKLFKPEYLKFLILFVN